MASENNSAAPTTFSLTSKDSIFALLIAASFGGGQLLDSHRSPDKETVERIDKGIRELQDPGGPVLRETVVRQKNDEETLKQHFLAIQELQRMVSKETIDDINRRLAELIEKDKEQRQQIEALRNSFEALRLEVMKATSAKLRGPM